MASHIKHCKHVCTKLTKIGCPTAPTAVSLEVSRINEGFPSLASMYLGRRKMANIEDTRIKVYNQRDYKLLSF